jgi:NAD+ diphosphatase
MGSQPWPFPGQLMLGFFADYAGGDIRVDGIEIVDAQWYPFIDLPNIPGEFSLSGQLIRLFVERCRQQAE